jgi:hypothetical protein
MKYFHSLHDFPGPNLGIGIPATKDTPGRAVGYRCNNFNAATIQFRKRKHALFDENGIIRLQVIWEQAGVNKHFHGYLNA